MASIDCGCHRFFCLRICPLVAVSKEQKQLYNDTIKPYKSEAEDLKKEISTMKAVGHKKQKLEPYFLLKGALLGIQRANVLVLMSRLSQEIQSIKNDSFLNDARKELNNHLTDLARLVGEQLDGSLTENQDILPKIAESTPTQRLKLLMGFRDSINNVKDIMGQSSKWRWSFPDTHLRLLTVARNMLDFKDFERTKDSNHENFRSYQEYMQFMMEESQVAAQEYRQKYELSTNEVGDLQKTEKIFSFQKQVYGFTGQRDELDRATNALENVKEMIESQMAEKQGKKRKKKK